MSSMLRKPIMLGEPSMFLIGGKKVWEPVAMRSLS